MKNFKLIAFFFAFIITLSFSYEIEHNIAHTIMDAHMDGPPKELFRVWHFIFAKQYSLNTELCIQKYLVFRKNLAEIKSHNSQNLSYTKGINEHTDLTSSEIEAYYNIKPIEIKDVINEIKQFNIENKFNLDDYNDDNDDPVVGDEPFVGKSAINVSLAPLNYTSLMTPVRSQGNCGSCWAFATLSMLEGVYWKLNQLKIGVKNEWLSPQELVDCDTTNGGCNGGWYVGAIQYYIGKKTCRETEYQYKSIKGVCLKTCTGKYIGTTAIQSSYDSVDNLYKLLNVGPVAVAVGVANNFYSFKSGIFDGKKDDISCTSTSVNHAVVVVGYGTLNLVNYWIIRNSWGSYWGVGGYMKIDADKAKDCMISKYGYQAVMTPLK